MAAAAPVARRYLTPILWIGGFLLFALFIILNRDLPTFLSYLALGLPQGAIIALIAVGYSMVYGIIQLINFAHGEVFMMSAYFALMFLVVPVGSEVGVGLQVVSGVVGLLTACTAWVILADRVGNKAVRLLIATAVGICLGVGNFLLLPSNSGFALPFFAALVIGIVYSCCLGVSMDLLAYKPLRNSPRLIALITAIGLSLLLQNFAQAVWGSASLDFPRVLSADKRMPHHVPVALTQKTFDVVKWTADDGTLRSIRMATVDIVIIGITALLLVGLQLFIHGTRTGKAMRACAQDRVTASLMGIQVNRMVALAFAIGAGLAAIAAPLYILQGKFMSPTMGYIVGILAFSSAVLGGIGNIAGAMLGGMIIGIIYSFVPLFDRFDTFRIFQVMEERGWVTAEGWSEGMRNFGSPGQYQLGVAYAFMILVIVFKPTGLLGRASAKRA